MTVNLVFLDDEPDLCALFSDEFEGSDVHVQTFTDPQQLLESGAQDKANFIFLDHRLAHTSGDEVAQKLGGKARIFLMTGDLRVKTVFPFEQILKKPFDFSVIWEIIKT